MNDMRKLIETVEQLDESVYFQPDTQRELNAIVAKLQGLIGRHELDTDDVIAFVEKKLYGDGEFVHKGPITGM